MIELEASGFREGAGMLQLQLAFLAKASSAAAPCHNASLLSHLERPHALIGGHVPEKLSFTHEKGYRRRGKIVRDLSSLTKLPTQGTLFRRLLADFRPRPARYLEITICKS